jgi:dihydropteroate synthase
MRALDQAVDEGADIVDVGGVRAGQEGEPVSAAQEIDRVLPFLERARAAYPDLALSLDTWRSEVARAAAPMGVDLVNDTWAGHDPDLVGVAAELGAGVVVSHTGGLPPRTDPVDVSYGPDPLDVVRDVVETLARGAEAALAAGVPPERILVDPTLDFGKTTAHSLQVLRHTSDVVALGFPVLQAVSRKDFVGESLDLPADERLEGASRRPRRRRGWGHGLPRARRARDASDRSTWWRRSGATGRRDWPFRGVPESPEKSAHRKPPHAHRLC